MKHFLAYLFLFFAVSVFGWQPDGSPPGINTVPNDTGSIAPVPYGKLIITTTPTYPIFYTRDTLRPQWSDTSGLVIRTVGGPGWSQPTQTAFPNQYEYWNPSKTWDSKRGYIDGGPQPEPWTLNANFVVLTTHPRYNWKRGALIFGLGLGAGASWGIHETSVHKPWQFPDHWNPQYWDASMSHTNKYWHGDKSNGPKFPGSTNIAVMFTDAKHWSATGQKAFLLGTGIVIGFGEKRPVWHYVVDLAVGFFGYASGFYFTYDEPIFW